jgi:hypothetical protein
VANDYFEIYGPTIITQNNRDTTLKRVCQYIAVNFKSSRVIFNYFFDRFKSCGKVVKKCYPVQLQFMHSYCIHQAENHIAMTLSVFDEISFAISSPIIMLYLLRL